MAIPVAELLSYSRTMYRQFMSFEDAKNRRRIKTAFLSHSHKDRDLAKGVEAWLKEHGLDVYIDWEDDEMPPRPTRKTAERIQEKIETCDWFFYLATANSAESKWCPWEIGYADKAKTKERLLIIPTTGDDGTLHGNEYLQLYDRIDRSKEEILMVLSPGHYFVGTPLNELRL